MLEQDSNLGRELRRWRAAERIREVGKRIILLAIILERNGDGNMTSTNERLGSNNNIWQLQLSNIIINGFIIVREPPRF